MPTATDLVTDLPADFEVFGQAVATSMADLLGGASGYILSKNSATDMDFVWIANDQGDITGITAGTGITVTSPTGPVPTVSINTAVTADLTTAQTLTNKTLTSPALTTPTISTLTTNGDLLYGTGSGALARKAIGSTGQVLTVAAGIPSWATPAGSSENYTLLNAGGTALSGVSTVTVSGISGINSILIRLEAVSTNTASDQILFRLNGDSGANYYQYGVSVTGTTAGSLSNAGTSFLAGTMGASALNNINSIFRFSGTGTAGIKPMTQSNQAGGSTTNVAYSTNGFYSGTSAISSVTVLTGGNNFDTGTIYVYGA